MDDITPTNALTPMVEITTTDRLRVFREDDEALAELAQITHARAIAEGGKDNAAGHLDLKIRERRAAMWGYDSPVRFDMVQIQETKRPSSYDRITATLMDLANQESPAKREAINLIGRLGPERALALLEAGTSDCTSDLPLPKKE